jgi:DNA-binding transcriptional MerR regulator
VSVGLIVTVFTVTVSSGNVEEMPAASPTSPPEDPDPSPDRVAPPPDGTDQGRSLRVDELAAATGVPVRTIREYQSWRVLHPPRRMGRVGLYDDSHVRRLADIARLQDRGYSIAAIRDLFEAWSNGVGLDDVLGMGDGLGPPADEAPRRLTEDQLAELLPSIAGSARLRARAQRIGLLVDHDGATIARSPALVQLVADAVAAGVAPSTALDLAATVIHAADEVGRRAAELVVDVADGPQLGPLLRRGRVLLARAVATHTIDRVGHHLGEQAESSPGLAALVEQIRIGTVAGGAPRPGGGAAGPAPHPEASEEAHPLASEEAHPPTGAPT